MITETTLIICSIIFIISSIVTIHINRDYLDKRIKLEWDYFKYYILLRKSIKKKKK